MNKTLILIACCAGLSSAAYSQVTVQRDPALRETTYSIEQGSCRISWTAFESELNRGGIRHRPTCELPLAEQAALIAKLLPEVLKAGEIRTLGWGRLFPDGRRDVTMSVRLALAAKRSSAWDAVRGKPRTGDINGFVRKLANDARIYEELLPVFEQAGFSIELTSVEKVLVMPAGQLPFFERLRGEGVRPRDRVPFDCQTWFSIRRKN